MNYADRVAARALDFQPSRLLLSVLALPFYVLGWVLGLVLLALSWAWAAVLVGVTDARRADDDADEAT